ncbi:ubiquinol-cytochrome C chaperone [Sphingomonas piscis]|uniref:Ubiquinol-cytochrome C chaperone n=1 Tax=Sphingomonas piscis TaxID=2714943 RepID=A0A6G7YPS7_9SPHN|nr:ubiquinol-cytochrome C chaperone family protein [Sphingomonas piscis]QIK78741.1 ubiquinol-cytochrome C chaperone [Sphingomonas piscis]
MFRFLFPRLTPAEPRNTALFSAAVAESRKPFWYADLGVPDTLDGRFSVLATVCAFVAVRLERGDESAQQAGAGLVERFVESMDHEHRQLGYGDPTLGKIVRKLTGALSARVDRVRAVVNAGSGWNEEAAEGLNGVIASAAAGDALKSLWQRLEASPDGRVVGGEWA